MRRATKSLLQKFEYGARKSKVNLYIGKGKEEKGVAGCRGSEVNIEGKITKEKLRRRMNEVNKHAMCNKIKKDRSIDFR